MPAAISKAKLQDVTFAILDTETTGLSPARGAKLCELAVLFVRGGRAIDQFQTLIDPQVPIEMGAQRVHGITDAMVAGKPTFSDIAKSVSAMLHDKVLVCHNLSFDRSFLSSELRTAGVPMPRIKEVCTLKLARRHFNFRRNSLGHIVEALSAEKKKGLTTMGAHRALHDVRMLRGVFEYFLEELERRKKVVTLQDLLELVKA